MILTLKELADYLRVNERTILRMLKSGQIQGAKIGGQWRFNGSQIDGLFFPESADTPEEVPLTTLTRTHIGIPISRVMHEDRVTLDLQADTVEEALEALTPAEHFNSLILDLNDLRKRLIDRETLLSTAVGHGIAIPHPRDPLPTLRAPAVIAFGRSDKGIDFSAMDGAPVHLIFMLCCQNIQLHLHLMGRLAQLLRNETFVEGCRTCAGTSELMRLVMEQERDAFLG